MNLTVPRVITGDSHVKPDHPLAEVEGGEMSWGILGKTNATSKWKWMGQHGS